MKTVLLFFELIPDEVKVYVLSVTDEMFESIKRCHGHHLGDCNCPVESDLMALSDFLEKYTPVYTGCEGEIPAGHYDAIVVTGRFMQGACKWNGCQPVMILQAIPPLYSVALNSLV